MAVFIVGFFDVLRAGFAERRTTAGLNGELVAKAPGLQKYRVRLDRVALPALPTRQESPHYQVKDVTTRAAVRRSWGVERDIDLKSCQPIVNFTPTPFTLLRPHLFMPTPFITAPFIRSLRGCD